MDEERARQNDEAKATGGAEAPTAGAGGAMAEAAADGEDSHDEEYYIEQAKKLSMMPVDEPIPDAGAGATAAAEQPPAADP